MVIQLCGSLLELYFNERKTDDMTKVLEGVKACIDDKSIDPYVKELMTNILELQRMGWNAATRAPTATASVPVVNPYLEANPANNGAEYYDEYNNYSDEEAEYLQQAARYALQPSILALIVVCLSLCLVTILVSAETKRTMKSVKRLKSF